MDINYQKFSEVIKQHSLYIATELQNVKLFDVKAVEKKITASMNMAVWDAIQILANDQNSEYLRLLKEQSNLRVGTPAYVKLGYKLAVAKRELANTNRMQNEASRAAAQNRLRTFVVEKFGENALDGYKEEK